MKARDLMMPVKDYLNTENTIEEAVNLVLTAKRGEQLTGVKGLPVLDAEGKLIGMLTMRDILKAVFPSYMSLMNLGEFAWDGMLEQMAKKVAKVKVGTIMSKQVLTVDEDAPLMECVDHMIKGNIKRLPVVDKNGRVVGMLYERDIFVAITKAMHQNELRGDKKAGGKKK